MGQSAQPILVQYYWVPAIIQTSMFITTVYNILSCLTPCSMCNNFAISFVIINMKVISYHNFWQLILPSTF